MSGINVQDSNAHLTLEELAQLQASIARVIAVARTADMLYDLGPKEAGRSAVDEMEKWAQADPRLTPEILAYCAAIQAHPGEFLDLLDRLELEALARWVRRWSWMPWWLRGTYWWLDDLWRTIKKKVGNVISR